MTTATTIIRIDERAISAQHHEIRPSHPASGAETLLNCLLKGIWQIMPPIAVFVASIEGIIGAKFYTKGSDISLTGMGDSIYQPVLQLVRKIISSYAMSVQDQKLVRMNLRTDNGTIYVARSENVGAIATEIEAMYGLDWSSLTDAQFKVFQAIR